MKRQSVGSLVTLLGLALSCISVNAATVQVQWEEPGQYRDIRTTNGVQKRFQASVMEELEVQFQKSAQTLPEDQVLQVTVKDLDLAGEIEYFYRNYPFGLRVVRNVDAPAMTLGYSLVDSNGTVLRSGEERVVDLGFNFSTWAPLDRSPLHYEKVLIRDWVRETFNQGA